MAHALDQTPERVALDRFARFFQELREGFSEREDVLAQMALALLAREHVLITGPPGTGKSFLTSSVLGRIVCTQTGKPSLFAKQFTESTVQTELIGPIDFRTLTESGRTEHFTDEGMLGAVHAFLDEVFDGRDMLLRATLNLLEERELKQGTKITRGKIECAVMTSNRYLTEALEGSRQTLLAFVDRIAFVAFIPRTFAEPDALAGVLERKLAGKAVFTERLTIQDIDVLQDMVERVDVPPAITHKIVELARAFETRVGQLERSDPSFTATRYLSTRAVIRLASILRAVVVYDRAFARPDRALRAEVGDLGALRLALMLAGPSIEDVDTLLADETEARERRQLNIMRSEWGIFSDCIRSLSLSASPEPQVPAEAQPSGTEPAAQKEEPEVIETHRPALMKLALSLRDAPELSTIEDVFKESLVIERKAPELRVAAEATRGQALIALAERVVSASPNQPTQGALRLDLDNAEYALALRHAITAAEVRDVDLASIGAHFSAAHARLGVRCEATFDAIVLSAVEDTLRQADTHLAPLLDALEPVARDLRAFDTRYTALEPGLEPKANDVLGRRILPSLRATYARLTTPSRRELTAVVQESIERLSRLGVAGSIELTDHLSCIAEGLVRGEPSSPSVAAADGPGYRAMRAREERTPVSVALCELLTALQEADGGDWTPTLGTMAAAIRNLPEALQREIVRCDNTRIERAADVLERWAARDPLDPDLNTIAFEEGALLRFALESRLLTTLFGALASQDLATRLDTLRSTLYARADQTHRDALSARWAALGVSDGE